jgi:hypothetical protein
MQSSNHNDNKSKKIISSYIICCQARTGSELLCSALRGSGLAGRPDGYFDEEGIDRKYWGILKAQNFEHYITQVLSKDLETKCLGINWIGASLIGLYLNVKRSKRTRIYRQRIL